jgi:uncharacterized protein YbcV (DUF1398 family)
MDTMQRIRNAYKMARDYPSLMLMLIDIGIDSYTVDVATSTILYRMPEGENIIHVSDVVPREIARNFNKKMVMQAIKDKREDKSDYPVFMSDLAKAGVRFYEATLHGATKRVTYIGPDGHYEEKIPL